jgi:enoyl-CoA hydratase
MTSPDARPGPPGAAAATVLVTDVDGQHLDGGEGIPGAIRMVTIDRPSALNSIDPPTMAALLAAFEDGGRAAAAGAGAGAGAVRVMILTGAGPRAFAAGADIAALAGMSPGEAQAFSELGHRVAATIEALPVPVIAAVNGFALGGGCEMALACDFIFATDAARFGLPEVKLGAIPGFGGTQRLPRRIGAARAREWLYTGALVGAEEAARLGLVNRVFPGIDALMAGTRQVAAQIAAQPPLAVAQAKRAVRRGLELTLPDACRLESALFGELFTSDDLRRGMQAFIEAGQARRKGQDQKET